MKPKNRSLAFTLLELVVVLAILSIVTALAIRSIGGVEDQRRYEANQRDMDELQSAVLGSPDDRAADGSRMSSGFVADMGRLPVTMLLSNTNELALSELWSQGTGPTALPAYGVRTSTVDSDVQIAAGWHGPYLQLPLGSTNLLDGWGNRVGSLTDATPGDMAAGYPRLQDASGAGITTAGQQVGIVEYLGANGTFNNTDQGVDQDFAVNFAARYKASVSAGVNVDALDQNDKPAPVDLTNYVVVVRVFGPDPTNALQLLAASGSAGPQTLATSLQFNASTPAGSSTIGLRAVRAYLYQSNSTDIADSALPLARSRIKYVNLVSGVNFIPLTISYRPASGSSTSQ